MSFLDWRVGNQGAPAATTVGERPDPSVCNSLLSSPTYRTIAGVFTCRADGAVLAADQRQPHVTVSLTPPCGGGGEAVYTWRDRKCVRGPRRSCSRRHWRSWPCASAAPRRRAGAAGAATEAAMAAGTADATAAVMAVMAGTAGTAAATVVMAATAAATAAT